MTSPVLSVFFFCVLQQAGIPEGLQAEPLSHWGMVQGLVEGEGPEQGLQEGERLQ